ncbi:MmgE/PrpD family protein [Paraburkholderia sp. Ac-20342]|uniref:MmgE/PrpD family protein n=1 Tax=Paraburkholderia sp. Ac-20342 TaxID=2703889 RepID=UPI00198249DE|nr:MmgE/PrpD family protein [Paraburkholderia sp. Ac-20342]MBN3849172.1 MmgE/PrpD family protein [Paraburkholderia sp. Ac-20342]
MSGMPVSTFIEELAGFAASASSEPHREAIGLQLADSAIALLAGAASAEGQAVRRFVADTDGGPLAACASLAATMRLTEVDDIHRSSAVTPSAIVLPAALTLRMSFAREAVPSRFADALFVGEELSIRLALALGGVSLLTRGGWPSYMVAPFGAAATAGRLLGLTPERMRHALALAAAQTPPPIGRATGHRPGRWLLFGQAVRAGCVAALAAADGIDGDVALLNDAWLGRIGGEAANAAWLARKDSDAPARESISVKPHCAAKQALAAVHGLQALLADGLDPAAIEAVEVRVPSAYAAMLDREPPEAGRLASLVSVRGQLALTALQPASLDDVARDGLRWTADLADFAARVRVMADPSLDGLYPAKWPARVSVRAGASTHELTVADSAGDPALRFGMDELAGKATRMLGAHPAADLVDTARRAATEPAQLDALCARFWHDLPGS